MCTHVAEGWSETVKLCGSEGEGFSVTSTFKIKYFKIGVVAYVCIPATQEDARKFQASLSYMLGLCLNRTKNKKEKEKKEKRGKKGREGGRKKGKKGGREGGKEGRRKEGNTLIQAW